MATSIPTLPNYNLNPTPQTGSGAYGAVPGAIGLPENIFQQVSALSPTLTSNTNQIGTNISQLLKGVVPTDVQNQIQNSAAQWGVASGMPGSGLAGNKSLRDLGLTSLQTQQTGLSDYMQFLSGVGNTLTSPDLASSIASRNATMAAAPNPQQSTNLLLSLLNPQEDQGSTISWGGATGSGSGSLSDPATLRAYTSWLNS